MRPRGSPDASPHRPPPRSGLNAIVTLADRSWKFLCPFAQAACRVSRDRPTGPARMPFVDFPIMGIEAAVPPVRARRCAGHLPGARARQHPAGHGPEAIQLTPDRRRRLLRRVSQPTLGPAGHREQEPVVRISGLSALANRGVQGTGDLLVTARPRGEWRKIFCDDGIISMDRSSHRTGDAAETRGCSRMCCSPGRPPHEPPILRVSLAR
jgi:hypothetical protein